MRRVYANSLERMKASTFLVICLDYLVEEVVITNCSSPPLYRRW